jgi:phosphonate transport system ATP-binding protein
MIQLKQLSVVYNGGELVALHPLDIEFRAGEFTVLLGPSGAGKSTLLRSVNLLNTPTSGSVHVDQQLIHSDEQLRNHRRNTAMIFQQHQLIKRQNVLRNALAGRLAHYSSLRSLLPMSQDDRRLALNCLQRVGLLDKALQRVDTLSGGQQQRVGIARALVQQPRVILADEPVASLDPRSAQQIMDLLQQICREDGITAIVSLHQLELAKTYAQRVIGLSQGRVVFDGKVDQLNDDIIQNIYSNDTSLNYETSL